MKRQPCNYCSARGGKRHANDCNRPQSGPCMKPRLHPTLRPQDTNVPRNRVAFVIDRSGSMASFRNEVPKILEEQIAELRKNAAKTGQPTSVTVYSLADTVTKDYHSENVFDPVRISYRPDGQTALYDGVGSATSNFQDLQTVDPSNTSYLIIVLTDGAENGSKYFSKMDLQAKMQTAQATDRFTYAFSVPHGNSSVITRAFGVPAGNVQEWDQTNDGLEMMNTSVVNSIGGYYGLRSAGMTHSSSFFTADMNAVSKSAIRKLDDLSQQFQVWNVDSESPIREFVERQLTNQPGLAKRIGKSYQIGRGYYQLTKSEEVQAGKDLVILDKATNALYGGVQARGLIGCPMHTTVKVKPGDLANYEIFIKSTSVNRKLVQGTKMIYSVT